MIERVTFDGEGYGRILAHPKPMWSREAGDGLGMGDVGRMNGDGGVFTGEQPGEKRDLYYAAT